MNARARSPLTPAQATEGLTLIEVLVGVGLLVMIGSALIGLLPPLAATNRDSEEQQRATLAAKSLYETVQATLRNDFNADLSGLTTPVSGANLACRVKSNVVDSAASSTKEKEIIPAHEGGSAGTSSPPPQRAKSLLRRVTVECSGAGQTYTYALDIARGT